MKSMWIVSKTAVDICFLILFTIHIATAMFPLPARVFLEHEAVCRVDVVPRKVEKLPAETKDAVGMCTLLCYGIVWCQSFNVRHSTQQCELFDSHSSSTLTDDPNCMYKGKISLEMRKCGRLNVVNGMDVQSLPHAATTAIICDAGYGSLIENVTCLDGVFSTDVSIKNGSVKSVACRKLLPCGSVAVENGEDIPAGTPGDKTVVVVNCNPGFIPEYNNLMCDDGELKGDPNVRNGSITNVTCYDDNVCGELVVFNGTNIPAGSVNGTTVEIVCDAGLTSYYLNATCDGNAFQPSKVVCGAYPVGNASEVVLYQGQFYKLFAHPAHQWHNASSICEAEGGVLATIISPHLMSLLKPMFTNTFTSMGGASIGLRQKMAQSAPGVGWLWINSLTDESVDIDNVNGTWNVTWLPGYNPSDGRPQAGVETDLENYGCLLSYSGGYGVADTGADQPLMKHALCQIAYEFYEFVPVSDGSRMTFPIEKLVTAATLENCTVSCQQNVFCRAFRGTVYNLKKNTGKAVFSYSALLADCRHHSSPPGESGTITIVDPNYIIYA